MIKLYENIKTLRKENGWSQDELAKKMGYTDRSMIAKIESGAVDLSESKILAFAKVFGVKPCDLMGWDEPAAPIEPAADSSSVAPVQLRADEFELLDKYNLLNDLGRNKAYEYVSDLTENEKYIQALEESNKAG